MLVIFKWRIASIAFVPLVVALLRKLRRNRLCRVPYVSHVAETEHYISSILHGSERHCVSQIRMKPIAFHQLCDILTEGEHIQPTVHMSVREQVLIFLHMIGYNVRFHIVGSIDQLRLFIHISGSSLGGLWNYIEL